MKTTLRGAMAGMLCIAVAATVTALHYRSLPNLPSFGVSVFGIFLFPALLAVTLWKKMFSRLAATVVLIAIAYATALSIAAGVFKDGI